MTKKINYLLKPSSGFGLKALIGEENKKVVDRQRQNYTFNLKYLINVFFPVISH